MAIVKHLHRSQYYCSGQTRFNLRRQLYQAVISFDTHLGMQLFVEDRPGMWIKPYIAVIGTIFNPGEFFVVIPSKKIIIPCLNSVAAINLYFASYQVLKFNYPCTLYPFFSFFESVIFKIKVNDRQPTEFDLSLKNELMP